jgi:hypothetical protein
MVERGYLPKEGKSLAPDEVNSLAVNENFLGYPDVP